MTFAVPAKPRRSRTGFVPLLAVLCATPAVAQPAAAVPQPTAADSETARSWMDEADELAAKGDLWSALERYQAAHQLMHAPTTGLELARAQANVLLLVEARATALATARLPVQPGEAAIFAQSRKTALELSSELVPRIPDLTLTIEPDAVTESLFLDGNAIPRIPRNLPYKLNPGAHVVRIEADGYEPSEHRLSLEEAEHGKLKVSLAKRPGEAPAERAELAAAPSAATRADELDSYTAGRTRAWIGFAAGGAVLLTGAVTGIVSLTTASEVRDRCRNNVCPESARADYERADTLGVVSNIAIPLGLVGIGYGLFEFLTHPAPHVDVALTSGGVVIHGSL